MFVFLSKLLPVFFYPVSLACLLLLAALRARRAKWKRGLILTAVVLLFVFGNDWFSSALVRSLEWQYLPPAEYPQADAIVILGGGTHPAEYPRQFVEVSDAGDRLIHGARLYREGLAPWVIVTGGPLPWESVDRSAAEDMKALLEVLGVPPEAVIVEGLAENTYQNALFTRRLSEPLGIDHILLVTSALHMPRSLPLFENQGFEVVPAPADYTTTRAANNAPLSRIWPDLLISVFPSSFAMAESTAAMKEYYGIAVYWLRGWW